MFKILVINPGSTSTKIAIYEDEKEIIKKTIHHDISELKKFRKVVDQYEMRKDTILEFLEKKTLI